jgi:ATP-dependent Clp protease ATP-binding subunit ClpB
MLQRRSQIQGVVTECGQLTTRCRARAFAYFPRGKVTEFLRSRNFQVARSNRSDHRLDKMVVFHLLNRAQLEEVLQIEIRKVQGQVSEVMKKPFLLRITEDACQFLLDEGTDQRYGARHLNSAIEKFLVHPLARLVATHQLGPDDILVDQRHPAEDYSVFTKKVEQSMAPVAYPSMNRNPVPQMTAEVWV